MSDRYEERARGVVKAWHDASYCSLVALENAIATALREAEADRKSVV